ncbi:hypothetical protein Dimus_030143 [Dionaea muscipula]
MKERSTTLMPRCRCSTNVIFDWNTASSYVVCFQTEFYWTMGLLPPIVLDAEEGEDEGEVNIIDA